MVAIARFLHHEEGAAAGSQFHGACADRFSNQLGQFIMLTQSQRLAVQIHNGGAHIVAAVQGIAQGRSSQFPR